MFAVVMVTFKGNSMGYLLMSKMVKSGTTLNQVPTNSKAVHRNGCQYSRRTDRDFLKY